MSLREVMITRACRSPGRPEKVIIKSPRAGVRDSCELPNFGARNQTWVLCKNTQHMPSSTEPPLHCCVVSVLYTPA